MAIQYYMRGYYATGGVYVDWVVNDQPDSTGAFAPVSPLTNITVNRVVTSKVGNFLNPTAEPTFINPNYTNPADPYFLHLNSYDWLNPSPPNLSTAFPPPTQPIGLAVVRGAATTSGPVNPYAALFWEESTQLWNFNLLNANGTIGTPEGVSMGSLFTNGPINVINGYIAVSDNTDAAHPPADTGIIRIPNLGSNPLDYIAGRNSTNTGDVILIAADSNTAGSSPFNTNRAQVGSSTDPVHIPGPYIQINNFVANSSTANLANIAQTEGFIRQTNNTLLNAWRNNGSPSPADMAGLASTSANLITLGDVNNLGMQFYVGTGSPVQYNFFANSVDLLDFQMTTAAGPNLNNTSISFGPTATLPSLTQANPLTSSSGQALHISAQHGNGAGNLGGPVLVHAGVGLGADGYVDLGVRNSGQTLPMLRVFPNLAMNLTNSPADYRPYTTSFTVNDKSTVSFNPVIRFPQTFLNISSATNANPIVITTQSSAGVNLAHGLATGQRVAIAGCAGNTAANGTWAITVLSFNTFSIPTTGNGTYVANTGSVLPVSNLFGNAVSSPAGITGPTIAHDDNQAGSGLPMTISAQWSTFSGGAGGNLTTSGGSATTGGASLGGKNIVAGGNAVNGTVGGSFASPTTAGQVRSGGNVLLQPGSGSGSFGAQTHGEIDFLNGGTLFGRIYADEGFPSTASSPYPFLELGSNLNPAKTGMIRLSNSTTDSLNPVNKTALAMRNIANTADILLIGSDQDGYVVVGNGSSVIIGGNFVNSDVNPALTTTYIAGNLQVWGTSTIVDSTIIDIVGRVIHANWPLNPGGAPPAVAPPTQIAGYDVNRGYSSANVMNDGAAILWTEGVNVVSGSDGYWRFATISQDGYNTSPRDSYTIANSPNALSVMASSFAPVSNSVMNQTGASLISSGVLPGVGGLRTLNNTTAVSARNAAATADLLMLGSDASNHIVMGASSNPQNAGFIFNTPSGDLFDFWVNSTSEVQISSDGNGPFVRESATTFVPATTGFIRVPNNVTAVAARGQANTFDHLLLATDTNDHITMGASSSPHNTGFIFNTLGTTTSNAPFDFWVNSVTTVQLASSDYDADLFSETIGIGPTVSNPRLYQITQSGTGANAGFNMKVSAQSGQLQTGATNNNNGGNMFVASGKAGTGGTGAAAVDGYVGILGGTTQIVYFYDYDPDNDGYAEAIQIGPSILYPRIYQAVQAGTGNSKGYDLKIQAQQGQAVSSGTNNSGGNLILASGPVGTGGTGGSAGNIELDIDGTIEVIFTDGSFQWQSGLTNAPTFSQANITTASAIGQTLTVQAQNATGTTSTGGNLNLSSGTGTSNNGAVQLQVGGTTTASVVANKFVFNQGRRRHVTPVTTTYQVLATDDLIAITTLSAPFTITLPLSPTTGDSYEIKDTTGNAGTNNVTINGNGNNIDASGTFTLNQPYGAITVTFTGSAWSIT